jgi:predicted ribosome quality control (RQC) complex YloA/Tae2 family protein
MTPSSFNFALMEILCKELQERVSNFKVVDCFPHDLRRFFLILHGSKRQEALFFCFAPPFLRFHLSDLPTSRAHSSHPLLSFLQGATLNLVNLLQQDRILQLTFSTLQGERRFIAEFFSKHPNYYLIQPDGKILFALHPHPQTHYQLPPLHSFVSKPPQWLSHREVEQAYMEIEKQWELAKEKQHLQTLLFKQLKSLQKKEQKLLESLKECAQWSQIQHEGDLIKSCFASIKRGTSSLYVHDWMTDQPYYLTLDPTKTPQEEMAARYKRAKKLQAGQAPLTQHLERTQKELHFIEQQQQTLQLLKTAEELAAFTQAAPSPLQPIKAVSAVPQLIYKEYQSATGVKIWVGKNAKANDRLTFQLANGRDWWLHVRGCPGSHVLIRLNKDQEPDSETLQDALQLALYYSKARHQGEGEICYTQRKYVSRLGQKKAGLVQISKHQTAWIRLDPARLQALKERSAPLNLHL